MQFVNFNQYYFSAEILKKQRNISFTHEIIIDIISIIDIESSYKNLYLKKEMHNVRHY